ADNPPPRTQQTARNHARRRIRTLDPAKLTLDDYLDLSSMTHPSLRFVPHSAKSLPGDNPWSWRFAYVIKLGDLERYPPGTHGFMYYHVPPNSSPLAGELRFRITPSPSPMSFASGADLLTENGQPWRYPLYKIMMRPEASREIAALLLQDQLVSQRTLDLAAAAALSLRSEKGAASVGRGSGMVSAMPTLSAFGQEFTYRVRADSTLHYLFVGPETIVRRIVSRVAQFRMWVDEMRVHYCPFEGTLVCCFERSRLPEHDGKRVAVIRVIRCVGPITRVPSPDGCTYPEELMPREGELLNVMFHGKVKPWAMDVDKGGKTREALRLLFENEALYGSSPCE
ncbi:hypothetical protein V8D89_008847, partial [Ganoderma adspersum]